VRYINEVIDTNRTKKYVDQISYLLDMKYENTKFDGE